MTDDQLIEKAKRAYFVRYGKKARQPSAGGCYVESVVANSYLDPAPGQPVDPSTLRQALVVLGDSEGVLARYLVRRGSSLRFVAPQIEIGDES